MDLLQDFVKVDKGRIIQGDVDDELRKLRRRTLDRLGRLYDCGVTSRAHNLLNVGFIRRKKG